VGECFGDLLDAGEGDAVALLDGERVIGGFEFDQGAFAQRPCVQCGLQVQG